MEDIKEQDSEAESLKNVSKPKPPVSVAEVPDVNLDAVIKELALKKNNLEG